MCFITFNEILNSRSFPSPLPLFTFSRLHWLWICREASLSRSLFYHPVKSPSPHLCSKTQIFFLQDWIWIWIQVFFHKQDADQLASLIHSASPAGTSYLQFPECCPDMQSIWSLMWRILSNKTRNRWTQEIVSWIRLNFRMGIRTRTPVKEENTSHKSWHEVERS